jgi:hypothetical protein
LTTRPSPRTRLGRRQSGAAEEDHEAEAVPGDAAVVVAVVVDAVDDLRQERGREKRGEEGKDEKIRETQDRVVGSDYDMATISPFKWNLAFGLFGHQNCMNAGGVGIASF